jgi:hypothetical protein
LIASLFTFGCEGHVSLSASAHSSADAGKQHPRGGRGGSELDAATSDAAVTSGDAQVATGGSTGASGSAGKGSGGTTGNAGTSGKGGAGTGSGGMRATGGHSGQAGSFAGPLGATGVWTNVTPNNVDLSSLGNCGNYGAESVQADAAKPGDLYVLFMCQGIWKSSDYGQTWQGPINTGSNGATVKDCAGALTLAPYNKASPPTVFVSCIRGSGAGFWKSVNGGVDWTRYAVAPAADNQQFYPPVVDPYDPKHLLMTGHAFDLLVESFDAGENWSKITTLNDMNSNGGTGGINFIDTGDPETTAKTWLWMASDTTVGMGTWRTENAGGKWTKVESNDHPGGVSETYQADTSGVIYMPGVYSDHGNGVFRSADYGKTWTHVGLEMPERVVFGTPSHMYAAYGAASGPGAMVNPNLEISDQPGTGTWKSVPTPAEMIQGPAQASVSNVGKNSVIVLANYNSGVWRFVEAN